MDLDPFLYHFVITKILNLSHEEWKLVQLDQYAPIQYQTPHGTTISTTHKMGEFIVIMVHIYGARAIFLLFFDNQDTKSESQKMEIGATGPIFTYKK